MFLAKLKEIFISKNRDSDAEKLMFKAEISAPDDIQEVEFSDSCNIDRRAPVDSRCFGGAISKAFKIIVAIDDNIDPDSSLGDGEIEIYSSNSGERKAKIRFKSDGSIVVNDGGDYAVKYSELETAFNNLQQQWDTFANAYVPGGPSAVGTPPTALPSTADITRAKVDTVRLP